MDLYACMCMHTCLCLRLESLHQESLNLKALRSPLPHCYRPGITECLGTHSTWCVRVCGCGRCRVRERKQERERLCVVPTASTSEQSPPSISQAHRHLSPCPQLSHWSQWGAPPPPRLREPDGRNQGLILPKGGHAGGLLPLP